MGETAALVCKRTTKTPRNLHGEPRCFYEAQLMLRTQDGKVIPSAEYLPSAEAAGLGSKIDRSLMLNVIDTLSKYHMEGRPGIVFVKLSSTAVQDNALLAACEELDNLFPNLNWHYYA